DFDLRNCQWALLSNTVHKRSHSLFCVVPFDNLMLRFLPPTLFRTALHFADIVWSCFCAGCYLQCCLQTRAAARGNLKVWPPTIIEILGFVSNISRSV